MKKRWLKIIEALKTHKLAATVIFIFLLILNFGVKPRVIAYFKGPVEKYETAKVERQTLRQTVSASGKVKAENQVTLRFQTSGQLAWLGVKEGDEVKKGQALASLDRRQLEKKLKKELNDYLNERWDFEQSQDDYQTGGQSLEKLTLSDAVRRILEKAQFDLNNSVIDVEIADLAVKLATITSPIKGIVTKVEAPVAGANITPATAEFVVANPAVMKFVANVDEADIGLVKIGQKVIISLDTYPEETFEGEVAKIAFAAVTTSGGGTAFPVEIFLPDNANLKFKVGMNGYTEIILSSKKDALSIPQSAIKEKESQTFVKIIKDKKISEIPIKTGLESDSKIEVISGLEEGQIVITGEKKK